MGAALRLHHPPDVSAGFDVVMEEDLRLMDEGKARSSHFVCPTPGCHVRMYAVLPEKVTRSGRPRASHFRLPIGTIHKGHGDIATTIDEDELATSGSPLVHSRRPTTWVDQRDDSETTGGEPESLGDPWQQRARAQRLRTDAAGAAARVRTSELRTLVDWWRSDQPGICDASIRMPMSTARTWRELFVDSRSTADCQQVGRGDRRVFYGPINLVLPYGQSAIKVLLSTGSTSKELTCYLELSPEVRRSNPELAQLILAARGGKPGTAYLLGTLMGTKVTVQSPSYIWIALEP